MRFWRAKYRKFPVIFPVSRESGRRKVSARLRSPPVDSVTCRTPASGYDFLSSNLPQKTNPLVQLLCSRPAVKQWLSRNHHPPALGRCHFPSQWRHSGSRVAAHRATHASAQDLTGTALLDKRYQFRSVPGAIIRTQVCRPSSQALISLGGCPSAQHRNATVSVASQSSAIPPW